MRQWPVWRNLAIARDTSAYGELVQLKVRSSTLSPVPK
jgi:hypothetical protein